MDIQGLKSVTCGFFVLCAMLNRKSNINNIIRHQDKKIGQCRILLCCYTNGALSQNNHHKMINVEKNFLQKFTFCHDYCDQNSPLFHFEPCSKKVLSWSQTLKSRTSCHCQSAIYIPTHSVEQIFKMSKPYH